ncbi:ABC transporter ATP-binding protein [Guggenheimella bovis]
MNIIEVKNLTKRYSDKLVVDNVSFDIFEGDMFGLIGPNGAGKSTTINMMTGLLQIDGGTATIQGHDITKESKEAKSLIGLVPQNLALIEEYSAVSNLEYFGMYHGLFGKTLKERVDEALEIVGLQDKRKDKVKTFSGGMKRRLNLGCSILHHPKILILDEPTVGVDTQSRNYIHEYLRTINREFNTTIVLTSHYMEEIEALCNRLIIIDGGKVVSYGKKEDIKKLGGGNQNVFVTTEGEAEIQSKLGLLEGVQQVDKDIDDWKLVVDTKSFSLENLIALLHQNNHKLKNLRIDEPSLEEVFLALTGKSLRD